MRSIKLKTALIMGAAVGIAFGTYNIVKAISAPSGKLPDRSTSAEVYNPDDHHGPGEDT